jgi:hypothetical protein
MRHHRSIWLRLARVFFLAPGFGEAGARESASRNLSDR